ncbi:MAG: MmgE/PrpD family protein [bacterium]
MMATLVEDLARFCHGLSYEDIPERVREKARLQVFSVLGAIHGSFRHEIGKTILEGVESWAGEGPCTIVPTGKKTDLLSAIYANASLSAALDYDDYLMFGHTGHSAVCVSLAMAEKAQRSFKTAMTAQIIANEIEGRLGGAVMVGPHNGQGWSHIHLAGSAAAAAKLLGLSEDKTAHAIAMSLYQPTYLLWPGFMGPDSKATTAASPAVLGVQAALLAAKGATGPLDIIEHPQGYLARMSFMPAPFFISGLGRAWVTDTLAYKVYPGCAYIDTTMDALFAILSEYRDENGHDLRAEDVEEVHVQATLLTKEMDNLSKTGGTFDPESPVSVNFSIPANVALLLLHHDLSPDLLSKAELKKNRDAVKEIAGKVRLEHDWSLTADFLEAMDRVLPFRDLLSQVEWKKLIKARSRIQDQYQSSMGFNLADLKELWQQTDLKSRLWKLGRERLSGRRRRTGRKFDLGDYPLHQLTMPFSARVSLRLNNGALYSNKQERPLGGPGHLLDITKDFVLKKYHRESGKNLETEKANANAKHADDLEQKLTVEKLLSQSSF